MQSLEEIRNEVKKRKNPILVGNSEGLIEERILVNSFHPQPRIYFSDYVKNYSRGLLFPTDYCSIQTITRPVPVVEEGLYTGEKAWEHPNYRENEEIKGFNPDFAPWYVFHIKGSVTTINRTIFTAFSKLVNWSFDLAASKGVKLVEISTRYMLYSSNNRDTGMVLRGDLVALQELYNVYVHLIPEITFYHLLEQYEPVETEPEEAAPAPEEPVLELHPDLLAMFENS